MAATTLLITDFFLQCPMISRKSDIRGHLTPKMRKPFALFSIAIRSVLALPICYLMFNLIIN